MKNKKITILRDIFEKGYWYVLHFIWANQKLLLEKSNVTYISQMVREFRLESFLNVGCVSMECNFSTLFGLIRGFG